MKIYVASKVLWGPYWQTLRAKGHDIISTWIDECEISQSEFGGLWECIQREISECEVLLYLHCEGEVPKGALVEVGMALALNKVVYIVGDTYGSWHHHPNAHVVENVEAALQITQMMK